ncbi:FBD-associated F-box protein [Hirschfeldia incana]|nr:FBD-associated F-box protein [Hirschfeldia incana]
MGFLGYYVRIRKRKVKRSKLCRRRQVRVCKDVSSISDLSDELLIKILSFLPTKVAVSTSILSKQWQFLWMWLPKLEYIRSYRHHSNYSAIRQFIDKYLPLHRAPIIESLSLRLSVDPIQPEDIKRWVEIAVSRYVRELDIYYDTEDQNIFPSSFYTCDSLVVLNLCNMILMDVPSTARLPSLKTLGLKCLVFQDDESLQGLLDICPVLEDLSVLLRGECSMEEIGMGEITVIVPTLQRLSLSVSWCCYVDGYVIDTPSLKYLKLEDWNNSTHDVEVKDMPELSEAYVDVVFFVLESVIGSITSVKRLEICSEIPERYDVYGGGFVFNQLEHLKLCVCKDYSSHLLGQLLKDSPNVRVLDVFHTGIHGFVEDTDMVSWKQPSLVPQCLLSSLQIFSWRGYFGRSQERDIAVYILKNACFLKKVTIFADIVQYSVPHLKMIKELAFSSGASSTCELVFVECPYEMFD